MRLIALVLIATCLVLVAKLSTQEKLYALHPVTVYDQVEKCEADHGLKAIIQDLDSPQGWILACLVPKK